MPVNISDTGNGGKRTLRQVRKETKRYVSLILRSYLLLRTHTKNTLRRTLMTTAATVTDATKSSSTKVRVPRKQLQRVDDLLARGYEGDSQAETAKDKFIWLAIIMVLFYISFEIFNYTFGNHGDVTTSDNSRARPKLKNPLVTWIKTGKLFGDDEF
jgi:ATP phosphoribosyltransferase